MNVREALSAQWAVAEICATRPEYYRDYIKSVFSGDIDDPKSGLVYALNPALQALASYGETYICDEAPDLLIRTAAETLPLNYTLFLDDVPTDAGFVFLPNSLNFVRPQTEASAFGWVIARMPDEPYGNPSGRLIAIFFAPPMNGHPMLPIKLIDLPFGVPIGEAVDTVDLSAFRFIGSFFTFISSTLLTTDRERADRASRRQLNDWHEYIKVIRLRRKSVHHEHDPNTDPVDWSHRWIVRGHWRQQFYPKTVTHQPKWITPHIKGPDDKPLKLPRAEVFAVVR